MVVLTGEISHQRIIIGRVRVLPHHSWNDLQWLVKGTLRELDCVLSDKVDPVFRDGYTFMSQSQHHSVKDDLCFLTQVHMYL